MRRPGQAAALIILALTVVAVAATPALIRNLKLGWEFGGGYQIDFAAVSEAGQIPPSPALVSAARMLTERAHATGYSEPSVDVLSNGTIRVVLPEREPSPRALAALRDPDGLPIRLAETFSGEVGSAAPNGDRLAIAEALGVGAIVAVALLLGFYGTAGATAGVALIGSGVLLLIFLNLSGEILSRSGIAAFLLGLGLAVDSLVASLNDSGGTLNEGAVGHAAAHALPRSQAPVFLFALIMLGIGLGAPHGFAVTTILAVVASSTVCAAWWFLRTRSDEGNRPPIWGRLDRSWLARRIDYLKWGRRISRGAAIIFVAGLVGIAARPLTYGPDFQAGTVVDLQLSEAADRSDATALTAMAGTDPEMITVGDANHVVLRFRQVLVANAIRPIVDAFKDAYGDGAAFTTSVTEPALAVHFAKEAIVVTGYATLGALLFLMFWVGWPAAIASLATIAIAVGAVICCDAIFGIAIDGNLIAGLLTTIGFALNGSVAVLDRIDENWRRQLAGADLRRAVNQGVRRVQLRFLVTASAAVAGAGALDLFGPEAFHTVALAAGIGAAAAQLASLFIAPLIWLRFHSPLIASGASGGRPGSTRIFGF